MRKLKNQPGSPLLPAESTLMEQALRSNVVGMEQEPFNNKRMSIKHFLEWRYTSYIEGSGAENALGKITMHFNEIVLDKYLKKRIVVNVNDSLFAKRVLNRMEIQELYDKISRKMNRVAKLKRVPKRLYLSSPHHSFAFSIGYVEIAGLKSVVLSSARYDNVKMVAKFSIDTRLDSPYGNMIYRPFGTPFYIGKKERDIESAIREEDKIWTTDDSTLILLDTALEKLLQYETLTLSTPYYTKIEMFTIKQVLKQFNNGFGMPLDIYNWTQDCKNKHKFEEFGLFDTLSNCIKRSNPQYPLIDFGRKEMEFITSYARKKFIDGEGNGNGLNLKPYLIDPSYGDIFRYELMSGNRLYEVVSTYVVDQNKDVARIFLSTDINNDLTIFSYADINNISNFDMVNSFTSVNTSLLFRSPNGVRNLDEIIKEVPDEFENPHDITGFVLMVIGIYIIIRDRPKRSKMVKCTSIKEPDKKKKNNKSHHNGRDEKEYVITRILKTTSDAKEYVSKMSDGYPDREYVLESWSRKGYYRRVSGGGTVWIPPTTCHRHLELTKKEIHIKL